MDRSPPLIARATQAAEASLSYRERTCEVCSVPYRPTYPAQRTCGRACGAELQHRNGKPRGRLCRRCGERSVTVASSGHSCDTCREQLSQAHDCDVCGKSFVPAVANQKRCSPSCAIIAANRATSAYIAERYRTDPGFRDRVLSAAHARRADKLGLASSVILLGYLMKRDRSRCGICRKPVRTQKGPMRPSIDHIVPLSSGGKHELANVQLAHYRCNLSKNNREQWRAAAADRVRAGCAWFFSRSAPGTRSSGVFFSWYHSVIKGQDQQHRR